MRLVHNDQVPSGGKDLVVLVKFAAHLLGAAHILHRGEIYIFLSLGSEPLERGKALTLAARTVVPVGTVVKGLAKIFEPTLIHRGAMRDDNRAAYPHLPGYTQGAEGLTKTHLCIPEHLIAPTELLQRTFDRLLLLRAQDDGIIAGSNLFGL